jgi:uncharacterized membrane protein YheB (UPF0754 family)
MKIKVTINTSASEKRDLEYIYTNMDNSISSFEKKVSQSFLEKRSKFTEIAVKEQVKKLDKLKIDKLDVYIEKELPKYISSSMKDINFKAIINIVIELTMPKNSKKIPERLKSLDSLGFKKYKIEQI